MDSQMLIFILFAIFSGAAILSTAALYTRQSLLVAYMVLGIILGPWCLNVVPDPGRIAEIGDIGIIFLLFLLGLHLHPQNLLNMLKKVSWIALVSSLVFGVLGFITMLLFKYSMMALVKFRMEHFFLEQLQLIGIYLAVCLPHQ